MCPDNHRGADWAVTVAAKMESVAYLQRRGDCEPETPSGLLSFARDAEGTPAA